MHKLGPGLSVRHMDEQRVASYYFKGKYVNSLELATAPGHEPSGN